MAATAVGIVTPGICADAVAQPHSFIVSVTYADSVVTGCVQRAGIPAPSATAVACPEIDTGHSAYPGTFRTGAVPHDTCLGRTAAVTAAAAGIIAGHKVETGTAAFLCPFRAPAAFSNPANLSTTACVLAPAAIVQIYGGVRTSRKRSLRSRAEYLPRSGAGRAVPRGTCLTGWAGVSARPAVGGIVPGPGAGVVACSHGGVKTAECRTVALDAGCTRGADIPGSPAVGRIRSKVGAQAIETLFPGSAPVPAGSAIVRIC